MRAALEHLSGNRTVESLKSVVGEHFGSGEDASILVESIVSLEGLRLSHGWSQEEIVEAASEAEGLDLDGDQRGVFASRLGELLSFESVALPAKIAVIAAEHEALFHTCRVVTDVRPVFRDEVTDTPVGAILTHDLRIDFFKDGRLESIHIAMSRTDLDALRSAVERAYAKTDALAEWMKGIGMPELVPEEAS